MNYLREITPLASLAGTTIVAGTATSAGTVDAGPSYEPSVGLMLNMGACVAEMTGTTASLHQSDDGSTWGTVGTVVSTAGTAASDTVVYDDFQVSQRYLRTHIAVAGAGGTAVASTALIVKPRTVD